MTFSPPPMSGTTPPTNTLPHVASASGEREKAEQLIRHCEMWKAMLRRMEEPNADTD